MSLYLPRAEDGRMSARQASPWQLADQIRGMADKYEDWLGCSGVV